MRDEGYADCTITPSWQWIENFSEWFYTQIVEDDFEIDKDLLVKGNKLYSPDTCVFVPRSINTFLTDRHNHRGEWPVGVTYHPRINKWQATCNFDGAPNYLGVFNCPIKAFYVYKETKESFAKVLAERWKGRVDPRAIQALENFEVSIDD